MGILLAFAPFIAFALVERIAGTAPGLVCGAAVSALLVLRDLLDRKKGLKILECGTLLLFGGLAAYALAVRPNWPIVGVRLAVDSGLFLIVLASVALRQPFTLQYAREQVAPEFWQTPQFIRTNYAITLAWAAAFAVMVAADIVMLYVPAVPMRAGIIVTILALVAAVKFTGWYPERAHQAP